MTKEDEDCREGSPLAEHIGSILEWLDDDRCKLADRCEAKRLAQAVAAAVRSGDVSEVGASWRALFDRLILSRGGGERLGRLLIDANSAVLQELSSPRAESTMEAGVARSRSPFAEVSQPDTAGGSDSERVSRRSEMTAEDTKHLVETVRRLEEERREMLRATEFTTEEAALCEWLCDIQDEDYSTLRSRFAHGLDSVDSKTLREVSHVVTSALGGLRHNNGPLLRHVASVRSSALGLEGDHLIVHWLKESIICLFSAARRGSRCLDQEVFWWAIEAASIDERLKMSPEIQSELVRRARAWTGSDFKERAHAATAWLLVEVGWVGKTNTKSINLKQAKDLVKNAAKAAKTAAAKRGWGTTGTPT